MGTGWEQSWEWREEPASVCEADFNELGVYNPLHSGQIRVIVFPKGQCKAMGSSGTTRKPGRTFASMA